MAKYSINGTEIIDDSGLIDWNKLINKPAPITSVTTTISNTSLTYAVCNIEVSGGSFRLNGHPSSMNTGVSGGHNSSWAIF